MAESRAQALPALTPKQDSRGRTLLVGLLVAAAILGGVVSWFASTHPDGLEWSISKVTGSVQHDLPPAEPWPAVSTGTSVSGLVGGALTLALAVLIGLVVKAWNKKT